MKKPIDASHQEIIRLEHIQQFASDVVNGLSSPHKFIPSRYFYDKRGSKLFEQISELPEYYLTRTEAAILRDSSSQIARIIRSNQKEGTECGIAVIELGSGNSEKTKILLDHLQKASDVLSYFPIDISHEMLQEVTARLGGIYPRIAVKGIPLDYGAGLCEADRIISGNTRLNRHSRLVVFLGSSIGNFEPYQIQSFVALLKKAMRSGQDNLLIGFDLHKDADVLEAAYNDKDQITAQFNLNLLDRINMQLGGNFSPNNFTHKALYNGSLKRIEMYLISKIDHSVRIGAVEKTFTFAKGESIHTENSYKYTVDQIYELAEKSNLSVRAIFTDKKRWFALALLGNRD